MSLIRKQYDAAGRANRYNPQPADDAHLSPLRPSAGDLAMFQAINRHGPLPSTYLTAFRSVATGRMERPSLKASDARLLKLTNRHNTIDKGAYLYRPVQQTYTETPHNKHLVYENTKYANLALKRAGIYQTPRTRNPWYHAFMQSCVTASFELACLYNGWRYVDQSELLARAGRTTLAVDVEIMWGSKNIKTRLNPDAIFAVENDKGFKAFCLEVDMDTERTETNNHQPKSAKKNTLQYQKFIGSRQYKDEYNLKCPMSVLHAHSSPTKMARDILAVIQYGHSAPYMQFSTFDEFSGIFRPPLPYFDILERDWHCGDGSTFRIKENDPR